MPIYNKLVRDLIPEIIHRSGKHANYHIADMAEYREKLYEKLNEELSEFIDEPCEEEAADIWEVFTALCEAHNINVTSVFAKAKSKAIERGKFKKRYILESVQEQSGNT